MIFNYGGVLLSGSEYIDDELRHVRVALSLYVGGALPPELHGTAESHGLSAQGWVFRPSAPVAGRHEDYAPELAEAGRLLREQAKDLGVIALLPGDQGWPTGTGADDLPCLWVFGDVRVADLLRNAITVTGTRDCTSYGAHVASDLGVGLAMAGRTVVTGVLPLGINRGVARGANAAGGRLLLVAAHGLDAFTLPPLISQDVATARYGAVVSAFPPGCMMTRSRYAVHHQLLGMLSPAAVVVEAARGSRCLTVAHAAADSGRLLYAVPGPVTSEMSRGCHDLIGDGTARLVTDAADVLDAIQRATSTPESGQLYRITGIASWDDGSWRSRRVPDFHVTADSPRAAADLAYEVVFAASPDSRGNTLDAGVVAADGSYEAVPISSTS